MSRTLPVGFRLLGGLLLTGMVAAGCAGGSPTAGSAAGGGEGSAGGQLQRVGNPIPAASSAPAQGSAQSGAFDSAAANSGAPSGQSDILIIKTGSLELRVKDLDAAIASVSTIVDGLGGYVGASQRSGDGDKAVAQITYRIPAARWDQALQELRAVGSKVLSEQTQSEEVTGQVIDLGARISNLRATEQALQAIMARATKIGDVLSVQEQLTGVRGQIEELSTQKAHLEARAAFSTLTVTYSLATVAVAEVQRKFDPASEVDRASASLVDLLQGLVTAGIWFGIVWLPTLLGLALLAAVGLFVARRLGFKRPLPPPPPPLVGDAPQA